MTQMAHIIFEINGQAVDWREMCSGPDAATGVMLGAIEEHYGKRFDGMRCPVHDEPPTIRFRGSSALELERELQACCAEFLARAWKKM